jgi:hypothetical protein
MSIYLSKIEEEFISQHGIMADEIYDATGQSPSQWKTYCEINGYYFVIGSRCRKFGHRLRSRSNHCIQCNTANIAYTQRHYRPGYVYIAQSKAGGIIKVGSTNNLQTRRVTLRNQCYGGETDWAVTFGYRADQAGLLEMQVHAELSQFSVTRTYFKGGRHRTARELYACDRIDAARAVLAIINDKTIGRFAWFSDRSTKRLIQEHCGCCD